MATPRPNREGGDRQAVDAVRAAAVPLAGDDVSPVVAATGGARLVLLGEASHGTHEFYADRARITRQLIEHHGFTAVIVEADWPDAYRVNRFVRGTDPDATAALGGFKRFPQWMWRNTDVQSFVRWLRDRNAAAARPCGFYGMDLYSLYGSIEAVLGYLDRTDPAAARRARYRYGCFEQFGENPQAYGYAAGYDLGKACEDEVIAQLVDVQRQVQRQARTVWQHDGQLAEDEHFFAERNAALVKDAEAYYRQMFARDELTWNLRDTHMVDTIDALLAHLDRTRGGPPTRAVVWAHNSHLGDARATDVTDRGELNVGQLCRQRWGDAVFNVGFTTHAGTVAAADDWGGPVGRKTVNPSLPGSYERLFHDAGIDKFALVFRGRPPVDGLSDPRIERAIGVIYRPRTERGSHYFRCELPRQFDAVVHVDTTSAVTPLEPFAAVQHGEAETYPTGV